MSPEYVGFADAVKLFFSNYANFKGRSTRSEYWWWSLAVFITSFVLMMSLMFVEGVVVYLIAGVMVLYLLAIVVPNIALSIRRLHDVGKSGWWFLINLVPFVGGIVFFVISLMPSDGANKWGEPAKV